MPDMRLRARVNLMIWLLATSITSWKLGSGLGSEFMCDVGVNGHTHNGDVPWDQH